jgi:hypothetical protein
MGNPDLIVLFTNPVSHEMIKIAKKKAQAGAIPLVQSHCASCSSLRNVLEAAKKNGVNMGKSLKSLKATEMSKTTKMSKEKRRA